MKLISFEKKPHRFTNKELRAYSIFWFIVALIAIVPIVFLIPFFLMIGGITVSLLVISLLPILFIVAYKASVYSKNERDEHDDKVVGRWMMIPLLHPAFYLIFFVIIPMFVMSLFGKF